MLLDPLLGTALEKSPNGKQPQASPGCSHLTPVLQKRESREPEKATNALVVHRPLLDTAVALLQAHDTRQYFHQSQSRDSLKYVRSNRSLVGVSSASTLSRTFATPLPRRHTTTGTAEDGKRRSRRQTRQLICSGSVASWKPRWTRSRPPRPHRRSCALHPRHPMTSPALTNHRQTRGPRRCSYLPEAPRCP